jgi:glycosyltransferase involved in cell wall biosynthesis
LSVRFSVVIPARNQEALLPRLLDTVEVARGRFRQGDGR